MLKVQQRSGQAYLYLSPVQDILKHHVALADTVIQEPGLFAEQLTHFQGSCPRLQTASVWLRIFTLKQVLILSFVRSSDSVNSFGSRGAEMALALGLVVGIVQVRLLNLPVLP